jgi:stage II sporulation protein D
MMKWMLRAALAIALLAAGCSVPPTRTTLPRPLRAAPAFIRVGVRDGNRITVRKVALEDYVRATIISEFAPASGDPATVERMFEVQAVIGRTYALANLGRHAAEGFDLCATTHCQLFQPSRVSTSRWAAQIEQAARQTASTVLSFDGAPVSALFHADCGGHTSRADDVWGGTGRSYLASIADDGPAQNAHIQWRYETTRPAVLDALNKDPRTRTGARFDGLQVLDRDSGGRVARIAIHGAQERVVRGEALREVLAQTFGARTIRSTLFTVRRDGAKLVFEGRGFGHGVGLCQAGALARLRSGDKMTAILERYYPGTKLVRLKGT